MTAVIDPVLQLLRRHPGTGRAADRRHRDIRDAEITSDLHEALTARVAHLLSDKALTPSRPTARLPASEPGNTRVTQVHPFERAPFIFR
ncbi:MAG: hypothetical protein ACT4NP_09305 [Pseudonocardiales bacterium]